MPATYVDNRPFSAPESEPSPAGLDAEKFKEAIAKASSQFASTGDRSRRLPLLGSKPIQFQHGLYQAFIASISEKIVNSGFAVTCDRLSALMREGDENEPKPSLYAFVNTGRLISEAEQFLPFDFPKAVVAADEEGGIRCWWRTSVPGHEVGLYCPSTRSEKAYVSHKVGDDYGTEDIVSGQVLAKWLTGLLSATVSPPSSVTTIISRTDSRPDTLTEEGVDDLTKDEDEDLVNSQEDLASELNAKVRKAIVLVTGGAALGGMIASTPGAIAGVLFGGVFAWFARDDG